MQKIIGIKPLSKVLGFGLLTVLLGHIQFDIPGSIGVKSNFTEIGLLISLGFLKHWIHFVILSLFSCFNVAPDGSLIPETLNHTAGILFLWFYYNKIKDQEENYKFIILMIIGILIYYYLIIIPLIYIIHLILGNIDINKATSSLNSLIYLIGYEVFTTSVISILFLIMKKELDKRKIAQKEIELINSELEARIEKRTKELIETNNKLTQKNKELSETFLQLSKTQNQLISKEKMAALGRLIAGIAHEINTPLGAIISSCKSMEGVIQENLFQILKKIREINEDEFVFFTEICEIIIKNVNSGNKIPTRMEKKKLMKDFSEFNIEMNLEMIDNLADMGIIDELEIIKKIFLSDKKEELLYLTGEISNLINSLNVIYLGGEKASTVVKALKNYSHRSENEKISEVILQNELEQAFTLFYNKMKANVELIRNYKTEGKIRGYKDQLSQVWINLISNSLYAMNNSGQLVAEIYENQEEVRVLLTDSGKGIPEDIQHRIFDPFFSTKKSGEGIGLGLDIVKKIIDTHEANIEVSSTPGKTTFTIIFNKNFEG